MEGQQTLTRAGRRYRLVPVRSTTTRTERTLTETKRTSVRNVKVVTTSRQGGQKIVNVDKKVVTTTSTTEGLLVLRSVPDGAYAVTDGLDNEDVKDTAREEFLRGENSEDKSEAKVREDPLFIGQEDPLHKHVNTTQNGSMSSRRPPIYTLREHVATEPDYLKHPAYSISCNDTEENKTHAERPKNCIRRKNENGIYGSKTTNELSTKAKNAAKETRSLCVASSSPTMSARNSTGDSDHHKNATQHTSEMIASDTKSESAYVRPGLVGNRFADLQPTKCVGSADVMEQTSAADGTGAKRPFLDMRSIWDVGQLIVATKSPRKPITCYKDYIS